MRRARACRRGYLADAWLVLLLAGGFGLALAGVYLGWSGRIERNKRDATYDVIPRLVPGSVQEATEEVEVGGEVVYKTFNEAGEHVGWVLPATGQGFGGPIEILIGLDRPAETITGVSILSQTETPGLGDEIASDPAAFTDHFAGLEATEDVGLTKTEAKGNQVPAITGATVSSKAVTQAVNRAVIEFRNAMHEGEVPGDVDEEDDDG
jgi:electron transport complex protein RnfG